MSGRFANTRLRAGNNLRVSSLWVLLGGLAQPAIATPDASTAPPEPTGNGSRLAPVLSRQESSLFALPTTRDHIGRVVVAATVNGKGPFRFIVDTGATHSTITPDLARALDLKPSEIPTIILNGITGTAQVSAVTLDKLQTGDLIVDGLIVPVVGSEVMVGADGILGAAGLTEKSISIDFMRNRVEISGAVQSAVREVALKLHATRVTHGLMILPMQVGKVQALAVIDTGSERTLGNIALRDALNERRRPGTVAQITSVYGATAQVEPGEIWRVPSLIIDTLRIEDVNVVYGNFHIFEVWGLQDKPAMIIGMDVLGTVSALGIDFKNRDVYVTSSHGRSTLSPMSGALADTMQKR